MFSLRFRNLFIKAAPIGFLLLFCLTAVFCSCFVLPRGEALVLPEKETVLSVEIRQGDEVNKQTDPQVIADLIDGLAKAENTGRESVNDTPSGEVVYRLSFSLVSGGENVLFVYQKNGKYFAERPYTGIWKVDKAVFESLS